jgi:hypothetical protein
MIQGGVFMTKKKNDAPATNLAKALRKMKKAVPPQDNPMLRHQAEQTSRSAGDEKRIAELRVKALEQLKRMPTNPVDLGDNQGEQETP